MARSPSSVRRTRVFVVPWCSGPLRPALSWYCPLSWSHSRTQRRRQYQRGLISAWITILPLLISARLLSDGIADLLLATSCSALACTPICRAEITVGLPTAASSFTTAARSLVAHCKTRSRRHWSQARQIKMQPRSHRMYPASHPHSPLLRLSPPSTTRRRSQVMVD